MIWKVRIDGVRGWTTIAEFVAEADAWEYAKKHLPDVRVYKRVDDCPYEDGKSWELLGVWTGTHFRAPTPEEKQDWELK